MAVPALELACRLCPQTVEAREHCLPGIVCFWPRGVCPPGLSVRGAGSQKPGPGGETRWPLGPRQAKQVLIRERDGRLSWNHKGISIRRWRLAVLSGVGGGAVRGNWGTLPVFLCPARGSLAGRVPWGEGCRAPLCAPCSCAPRAGSAALGPLPRLAGTEQEAHWVWCLSSPSTFPPSLSPHFLSALLTDQTLSPEPWLPQA